MQTVIAEQVGTTPGIAISTRVLNRVNEANCATTWQRGNKYTAIITVINAVGIDVRMTHAVEG
jgi:hypothetical protein